MAIMEGMLTKDLPAVSDMEDEDFSDETPERDSISETSVKARAIWSTRRLSDQTRVIVMNVHNYFRSLDERESETDLQIRVAEATGVSVGSVQRIKKEFKNGIVIKPQPPRVRTATVLGKLDVFDMECVRRELIMFYTRGEFPTVATLLEKVSKPPVNFTGSKSSLHSLVKKLGFCSRLVQGGKRVLMETDDIVTARNRYLKILRENRSSSNPRPVVYLDETLISQEKCVRQCCTVKDGLVSQNRKLGRGGRVTVVHAGGEEGFISGALLVIKSKSGTVGDHHQSMNHERFRSWFQQQLIPNIPANAVIVMDDAPYHCDYVNKAPTSSSHKSDMIHWLTVNKIPHDPSHTKSELLSLIKSLQEKQVVGIDQIALDNGHSILRLPPYHCHFNPIEGIWAQIKAEVTRSFSSDNHSLLRLDGVIKDAVERVSSEDWRKCIQHAQQIEEEYRHMDVVVNRCTQQIEDENGHMDVADDHLLATCLETDK